MHSEINKLAFVMPHFSTAESCSIKFLTKTLKSIFNQSDNNWHLIIIDDASTSPDAIAYLKDLQNQFASQVTVIFNDTNSGPGHCRNTGIMWAHENNLPVVMFIDADDICHPRRVEVTRNLFSQNQNTSVVYSTFEVIDENDNAVHQLSPAIGEITKFHKDAPPQGANAWIDIGTRTGYTNLTSATAVKTALAFAYPFPKEKVSEDAHTWYRYAAGGDMFLYTGEIPTLYRIPQNTEGSASRSREGGKHSFYSKMVAVDEDGFKQAIQIALSKNKILEKDAPPILIQFYLRQCKTMVLEAEFGIAESQLKAAFAVARENDIEIDLSSHHEIQTNLHEMRL